MWSGLPFWVWLALFKWLLVSFSVFICGLYTFFRAMSIKILCLFFNWVGLSFCLLVVEFFTYSGCVCVCLVAQLCLTLCDPMDCSPPGASVRGDSPGKHIGMGCHVLLQGIFATQGSNPSLLCLLHWQWVLYHQHHLYRLVQNNCSFRPWILNYYN